MPIRIFHLEARDAARMKLGARGISVAEARQLLRNRHLVRGDSRGSISGRDRHLLIGETDGGRVLTLVVERTLDPNSWAIVTGWTASPRERKVLD